MKRKPARHLSRSFASYLRGSTTISVILLILVIGAVLMVGGVFPREDEIPSPTYEAVPDEKSLQMRDKDSLQLETFPFKECPATTAVDFLIDNSGSMTYGSKMPELKKAMVVFGSNFSDEGILGLQIYSDPEVYPPLGHKELISLTEFKNIKNQYVGLINTMAPSGGTHSKDAMLFAKQQIDEAKNKYPNRKLNLVFISDGIPETRATNVACPGGINGDICGPMPGGQLGECRCFAETQDPQNTAEDIKKSGVRIFSIAYVDANDSKFNNRLQNLMRNVASSPNDYYQAPVESQLTKILGQISEKLCN